MVDIRKLAQLAEAGQGGAGVALVQTLDGQDGQKRGDQVGRRHAASRSRSAAMRDNMG